MRTSRTASAWIFAALAVAVTGSAEEPAGARKLSMVAPMKEGLNVTGMNGRGDVVGFHWEPENGNPDILFEAPFFARGNEVVRLPLLEGYTATFPAAVSDGGVVVGRAGKPAPPAAFVPFRNQAFVWTAESGIQGLGAPVPDLASFATGVSRDGRRIAGIGVGDDRLRGLLWEREGGSWKAVILPDADHLGSNVLAISPDGKRLAAVQAGETSLWTEAEPGRWRRESTSVGRLDLVPRGVNDSGMVVGINQDHGGTVSAVVWTREMGAKTLDLPPGYRHGQASAVNNAGVVVGQIDGPHGELPGPRAFVFEAGRLRPIDEGGPDFVWATAIDDAGHVSGVLEKEEDEIKAAPPPVEPAKKP